jgi:apolipoprotein D and lipocalin family protein
MTRILLAATVAMTLAGCATTPPAALAPAPAKTINMAKFYSGEWREIARRPESLTDGCVAGTTEYTVLDATHVKVRDTCRKGTPTGKLNDIGGTGTILDPGVNAKLHVGYRVFGIFTVGRDYWVLDHGDAEGWFISTDPTFTRLYLYTRPEKDTPALRAELVAKARALGYDVSKLEYPAQP